MEKQSEYELQAERFMEKTGTTMTVKLLGNMPHFDDDKESRDVYQVTLKRGDKKYSFRFGQSIADSKPAIDKAREKFVDYDGSAISSIVAKKKFPYKAPSAYDVLACVQKYDVGTFEDFCLDFGCDTDSRKAEKTYFAVQKEFQNIERLFGDVMEELQEIQ